MAVRHLAAAELAVEPALRPIRIAAHAFGNDRALVVSPQHGLVLRDDEGGGRERLIRAAHLARLPGEQVEVVPHPRGVTYVHLMFENHQTLLAHGLASESFYPGPWALRGLPADARGELIRLFPDLEDHPAERGYGPTTRPVARFRDIREDDRTAAMRSRRRLGAFR